MEIDNCVKPNENLGFVPQKDNIYNKLLPYADELDEESTILFSDIKTNLIKSILAREMRPGCALWTSRLKKYMKIYGLKFSKEDHIALIKLFYELITIPDLDPTRISKCASTLTQLLKKKYLLSRDELQLEWRPLYDLCVRVIDKSKTEIGMYRYFPTFEAIIFQVIKVAKVYFPASATQEILDEFRPELSPFSSTNISRSIQYLELFLPVNVKPEEADISYKLWFDEFMTLWNVCHNASVWENSMMLLMTNLCRYQMGNIDWEPYIPMMFVRFMRTLQLPVNFKQKQSGKYHKIDIGAISLWITYSLNGDKNSVFTQFEKFIQTLESYYHPANVGRWISKLRELLLRLSYYFVQRVHNERYEKRSWENQIPDHMKLTDDDIDRFINILKPSLEQAMFTRLGTQDISLALQYLASLRPNIIVPITLEKLYASMGSLTEPHRLTSSMMSVIAVGRYMVQGDKYPEGPTHVIPLLMSLLPGIDPNDIRKSYVTFNFIVQFINMVPLINSSSASNYHELTEEEHIVCEASAGLEDFVLQLFDRLCTWVESSSLDFVRLEQMTNMANNNKSRMETISERALASVITVVLNQSSPEIFTSALKKMFNFVINRVLEVQVAGKMVALAVSCFAKINPKETLKLFVPYLCDSIERLLNENSSIETDEHIDAELLYHLEILAELATGRTEMIVYMDRLTKILDKTLHVSCQTAGMFSVRLLDNLMGTLTTTVPTEIRSCPEDYSTPVKDFLSIRKWGKPQDIKDLKIKWYVPGKNEISTVQMLLNKYLLPELEKLNNYSDGTFTFTRQQLQQSLNIIVSILACQSVLPIWEEKPLQIVDSVLDPWAFNLKVGGNHEVTMPDGGNVRKYIVNTLHRLQKKILEVDEGDTKSIKILILIYNVILFNKTRNQDFEFHWKNFHVAKKMLEDRLHRNKLHLRHVLIERVILQHEFRTESRNCSFSSTHKQILEDLFELSVSRYSEVRVAAQVKLFSMISYFPYSYSVLKPKITDILKMNSEEHHERFKGCLYILIGPKTTPIVTRHDWEFIRDLWPLVVTSMPSEKPSIINLINAITDTVHKFFPTIAIKLVIPNSCLSAAKKLAASVPKVNLEDWKSIEDAGENALRIKSQNRRTAYETTLNALLDACESGKLHWRYNSMALTFLKDLVHFDVKYNSRIVKFFLNATIDESITIRKIALRVVVFILVQNKPKFKKETINPFTISNSKQISNFGPGVRDDNKWLLYDSKTVPKNNKEWDEVRFVHDQYTGHYAWPKTLEVYSASSTQPSVSKRMNNMSENEKLIFSFFSNADNVRQLIKYMSMEEKKGQDQFNAYKFLIFKYLFKMFEDELLPIILPHVEKLVQEKQESSQRCAAEIISALICGCKHWNFEKIQKLQSTLIPILQIVISNLYSETLNDWTLCFNMGLDNRDPNRYYWLLEFLMDDPLKEQTSFISSSRMHLLYIALNQQTWRNAELSHRLLNYMKDHLSHPFQNIREKISACLTLIFSKDLVFPNGTPNGGPRAKEFLKEILPKLDILYNDALSKVSEDKNDVDKTCENLQLISLGNDEEKEQAIRLFKTIAKYVTGSVVRVNYSSIPEFFSLIPLASILQSNEVDDELASISVNLLVVLAQTVTIPEYIPNCLEQIQSVANSPFWTARKIMTEFIPVFVFHNMATIISKKEWKAAIEKVVLQLLEDSQPEVRVSAGKVLSGLLHCQFISHPMELLALLKQKAKTKLKQRSVNKSDNSASNNIRIRHAGVLGLCAFIDAHPYDVPDYLPDVFQEIGPHLSDPQPMPTSIRKTLGDFKRTHHDNWEVHKLKFTKDELLFLSELTVPPSYYA